MQDAGAELLSANWKTSTKRVGSSLTTLPGDDGNLVNVGKGKGKRRNRAKLSEK